MSLSTETTSQPFIDPASTSALSPPSTPPTPYPDVFPITSLVNIHPKRSRSLSPKNPIQRAIHDRIQPEYAHRYMVPRPLLPLFQETVSYPISR